MPPGNETGLPKSERRNKTLWTIVKRCVSLVGVFAIAGAAAAESDLREARFERYTERTVGFSASENADFFFPLDSAVKFDGLSHFRVGGFLATRRLVTQ